MTDSLPLAIDVDDTQRVSGLLRAPADARALARHHLKAIDARIAASLDASKAEPDAYSRAHLEQLHDQIAKVLAAELKMNEP